YRLLMTRVALALCLLFSSLAFAKEKFQRPGPIHLDRGGEKWAEKTLRKMSTEEKIGQLFMIWARAEFLNVNSSEYLELRDTRQKYPVGSFAMTVRWEPPFLYRNQPYEAAVLLNRLQEDSKQPLLVAADFERGVTMRLHGGTTFPHAMAFGATGKAKYAEAFGRISGEEARAVGIHWNFFPDADVNSNPANPIINTRSFGEDPKEVGELVAAYIRGAHQSGMMTTVKHFPGHGDTATDSHLSLAQVTGDRARLQSVELPPFQSGVSAGVDSVMVAHVTVPALDPGPDRVATTSPVVVTELLKKQLGFQGIVVTDALDMAGLMRLYAADIGRASVDAFKAGNDLLLIPPELDASYQGMLKAVQSGEISGARLDASVLKLLKAKAALRLHKARLVDTSKLETLVGKPENIAQGQKISDEAVTLVRDNGKLLPLKQTGTVKSGLPYQSVEEVNNRVTAVIFSEEVRTQSGRMFERRLRSRIPDANVIYIDPRIAAATSEQVLAAVNQAEAVIVAVYIVPTAGKVMKGAQGLTNSVALNDAHGALLQSILHRAADKTAVVAVGNPYLIQDLPAI